jgi:outer membrane protein OmpA-like peptidoglycan-associated protein
LIQKEASACSQTRPVRFFAALGALVFVASAQAIDFGARPDAAEWKLRRSTLECRLSQPIPFFGEAVFRKNAGESPEFVLQSNQRLLSGDASLSLQAPPWRETIEPILLASVPVQSGADPVRLSETMADRILEGLLEGLVPVFDRLPSMSRSGHTRVSLVPVNFRAAYGDYRECLGGLLPSSFAQAARTRINYPGGGYEIDDAARARLDVLLQHLSLVKDVKAIYIDGYSDDTGRRPQNLELSKQRAQAVVDYLVGKGVDAKLVTMRYYGSRYPVARGRSAAARAENRRVTVRVERG